MKKIKLSRIISIFMVAVSLMTNFGVATVFAAESNEPVKGVEADEIVEPRAGTETLPLGWYTISSKFSIKGHNTTPVKTVSGRYLKLDYDLTKSATSEPIAVRIKIKDYNTGQYIGGEDIFFVTQNATTTGCRTITFDLGYAGRRVQIYTYIENAWSYTEHTASLITFSNYKSYVSY